MKNIIFTIISLLISCIVAWLFITILPVIVQLIFFVLVLIFIWTIKYTKFGDIAVNWAERKYQETKPK